MSIQTSYTSARAQFPRLCDEVTNNQEVVIIRRRGAEDVALISASELTGLLGTSHLLRSPKNPERLLTALKRAKAWQGTPQTIDELREEAGID